MDTLTMGIPFHLDRIDETLRPFTPGSKKGVRDYFRENFWLATSRYYLLPRAEGRTT